MKTYCVIGMLVALSAWNGLLVVGCLHDASVNVIPDAIYFWAAFFEAASAITGLALTACIAARFGCVGHLLAMWMGTSAAAVTIMVGLLFCPMPGVDSLPAVLFNLPQVVLGIVIVGLVGRRGYRGLGILWPALFLLMLAVTVVVHLTVSPAEQVIVRGPDFRAQLELYIPSENIYYLRPFSVALLMLCWTAMLLRPLIGDRVALPDGTVSETTAEGGGRSP